MSATSPLLQSMLANVTVPTVSATAASRGGHDRDRQFAACL